MPGDGKAGNDVLVRIPLDDVAPVEVLGSQGALLKQVDRSFDARVSARGNEILVRGESGQTALVQEVFAHLVGLVEKGTSLSPQHVQYAIDMVRGRRSEELAGLSTGDAAIQTSGKSKGVQPRTVNQRVYIDAIRANDVVLAIGPAGTGKTYLAVACAVDALSRRTVERIVLTRPAVEAGESLGFLPGDLQDKVDPYLRPLYDALGDMMRPERVKRLLEMGTIEVVPLAYMRGRTLSKCFVILDEAQNATRMQVKMFLTRLGNGSKAVITGDVTQVDLNDPGQSGLVHSQMVLADVPGVDIVRFDRSDVVRHPLVQRIIAAYEDERVRSRPGSQPLEGLDD